MTRNTLVKTMKKRQARSEVPVEYTWNLDDLFAHADLERAINLIEIRLDKDAFPSYLSDR